MLGGILSALIMNVITNALFDNEYYGAHIWPKCGTFWLTGAICIAAGSYLRKFPTKVRNKDWYESEATDHLFFIPVIYWAPIFFILGAAYFIYSYYAASHHS